MTSATLRSLFLASLLPLAGCRSQEEVLFLPGEFASEWELARRVRADYGRPGLREFVTAGERLEDWTRLVTVQVVLGEADALEEFVQGLQRRLVERCPDAEWAIVGRGANSVTYEWRIEGCPDQGDQHELARLLRGHRGLHRIAYSVKRPRMDPAERELWLERLARAYVADGETLDPIEAPPGP